jgi:integrase
VLYAPVRTAAPTFEQVANDLLTKRKRRGASENTLKDLRWRLETALGHFGPLAVDAIDVAVIEQFVDRALAERDAIEQAATTGQPLIERYVDQRTGRTYERRRRGLGNSSINKVIAAVRAVLKEARRHGHISDNPADDNELRVRERRPDPSLLQVDQVGALLEAAAALEREHHGLTWSDVERIRCSTDSAVSLARRLRVSDVHDRQGAPRRALDGAPSARPHRHTAAAGDRHAGPRRTADRRAVRPARRASRLRSRRPGRGARHHQDGRGRAHNPDAAGAAGAAARARDGAPGDC